MLSLQEEVGPYCLRSYLEHLDVCSGSQGVKVSAAFCLCNILRLYAGEDALPYDTLQQKVSAMVPVTDAQVCARLHTRMTYWQPRCSLECLTRSALPVTQDIFTLFLWTFRQLENPSSPLYTKCLAVLELVSQVCPSVVTAVLVAKHRAFSATKMGANTGQVLCADAGLGR